MTAVTDVNAAFEAALAKDAGTPGPQGPPEVPPPPRVERDPEAPHGRAADGAPLAPYGLKADGTPRIKAAGPGRPRADDKPRVAAATQTADTGKGSGGADEPDYRDDLLGLGTAVWLGASALKGGKLGPLRLPDTRPYALVWRAQMPAMAAAWNEAAKQNATVRGYVEKFTGEGSMTWIVGVAVSAVGLAAACAEMAKAPREVKVKAAAANDVQVQSYLEAQVQAMGVEVEG